MNFLQRLMEPSTWAGLGGIAASLASSNPNSLGGIASSLGANPTKVGAAGTALGLLLSAFAVFMPERGNNTPQS